MDRTSGFVSLFRRDEDKPCPRCRCSISMIPVAPQETLRAALGLEPRGWARRFFENWPASLKWQRLRPHEKFAEIIHYEKSEELVMEASKGHGFALRLRNTRFFLVDSTSWASISGHRVGTIVQSQNCSLVRRGAMNGIESDDALAWLPSLLR
jgi:hypothetical protein